MFYPSEKDLETLSNYIVVVEDVVPEELCDDIINGFKDTSIWLEGMIGGANVDKNIRNVELFPLSDFRALEVNPNAKELDDRMFESASIALNTYNKHHKDVDIRRDTGYEVLRYNEGQFYTQHTDSFHQNPRAVSCSFALNDDYEGGEFAFFDRRIVTKIKKGSAIMFPSNFMFPHEILQVTKGTRYSIITWFL